MEFKKGCPACEHTDPELEREIYALAKLLVDSYLEEQGAPPMIHPSFEEMMERIKEKNVS